MQLIQAKVFSVSVCRRRYLPLGLPGVIVVVLVLSAAAQNSTSAYRFHSITPLGSDVLRLRPANKTLTLMLTLECKDLDEAMVIEKDSRKLVTSADGKELKNYPPEITFRFTVGTKTVLDEKSPLEVQTSSSPDQFASHLHFRLKVFHGVDSQTLQPTESKIIGVPIEMPYDERIYRIAFKLNEIPAADRMMFEVLDDSGTRVAKFHLQLM
jgi:hypothetical protein